MLHFVGFLGPSRRRHRLGKGRAGTKGGVWRAGFGQRVDARDRRSSNGEGEGDGDGGGEGDGDGDGNGEGDGESEGW